MRIRITRILHQDGSIEDRREVDVDPVSTPRVATDEVFISSIEASTEDLQSALARPQNEAQKDIEAAFELLEDTFGGRYVPLNTGPRRN